MLDARRVVTFKNSSVLRENLKLELLNELV